MRKPCASRQMGAASPFTSDPSGYVLRQFAERLSPQARETDISLNALWTGNPRTRRRTTVARAQQSRHLAGTVARLTRATQASVNGIVRAYPATPVD